MMDWTILIVLAGLWLVSPIVLLIALVVSRHQLAEARRQAAEWERLARSQDAPVSAPLWQTEWPQSPPPVNVAAEPASSPSSPLDHPLKIDQGVITPFEPPRRYTPPLFSQEKKTAAAPLLNPGEETVSALPWKENEPDYPSRDSPATSATADDWRPDEPGPLERVLRVMSGWPRWIAPFLAQNIGWFVGGFCFVAGALFLVANTSGFTNALVVWGSLIGATGFLIWSGYQFRRQRSELAVASGVLLTLGLMLGPLDLAVAVRLFDASSGQLLLLATSALLAVLTLAAFFWMARLTSALIDRALPGRYAGLLAALAGLQLVAPLATWLPDWQALAVLHVVLLGLLSEGLRRFAREWLQHVFVDRHRTSYFTAGMLVYAATISFVHLTWVWPESLPTGYAGPFLMALCLLLFPVDAALKAWVHKHAFLSRFSFALYGLSIVAIAIAAPSTPAALLTLTLGVGLYGWMTWRYLTLLPLYLLFGCVAGLYGYAILQWSPPAWHLLLSLPGLLALLALGYRMMARSPAIARQCLLTFGLLLIGLTGWSLFWTTPGMTGFTTATTAALLGYGAMRWTRALPDANPHWAWGESWVVVLAAVAVAYAPGWTPFSWALQTAFGWLALAALWSGLGLQHRRLSSSQPTVWVTGALAMIVAALALAGVNQWPKWFEQWELIVLLALAGALLLWLSLGLRRQSLFYGVLAVAAALGVLVKHRYFPGPSTGVIEFTLVLALWSFLWWLDRRIEMREALWADRAEMEPPPAFTWAELIRAPLEQAMALLWLAGLVKLGLQWLNGIPSLIWPWSAGLGAIGGLLLIGRFHRFRWIALPMLLGLAGLLVELARKGWPLPWLGAASGLYALLVWRFGVATLDYPLTRQLARALRCTVPGGSGGRRQVEDSLHGCALLIAIAPVAISPAWGLSGQSALALWPMLCASLLVFTLTGWRYRTEIHAWLALITLTLGVWLIGFGLKPIGSLILGQPLASAGLSLVMAFAAAGLEAERAAALAWWRRPLWTISGLLYGLALVGVLLAAKDGGLAVVLAGLALYLGLLLRHAARPGIAGLALAALIASSLLALIDDLNMPLSGLPLTLVIWHGALLAVWRYYAPRSPELWQPALERWLTLLPIASVGLLLLVPGADGAVWSVTLLALAVTTLGLGEWQDEAFWRKIGLWLMLAGTYALWQWNAPLTWEALIVLSPWYALQSGLLLLLFALIEQRLTAWLDAYDLQTETKRSRRWLAMEQVISETTPWLLLATGLFLGLHISAVWATLVGWGSGSWHFGRVLDALAAGATLTLLTGWTALHAWRRPDEPRRIYAVVLLLATLAIYARLLATGLTPLTPWDTTVLLAAAGVAFLLHQWTGAQPWYRLALLLPLLALATAPWQMASPWMGGTLLTTGVLYLSLAGTLRNPLPLYLGMLALNGAVYLWAPLWAGRYGLWQFYLIPGAVSVLALLHLHRRELRPSVLNGGRLAALSVLYAGAGLDVFLQPELWVFVLALVLALAGIIAGIALRIRAFLYAGVAFLVLNVAGQLLQFYPEQGVSRALILIGLGATITGGMVLFNLKREAILQRIRIMRADLAGWE